MPVYQCYSPKGLVTASAKAKMAEEMTAAGAASGPASVSVS